MILATDQSVLNNSAKVKINLLSSGVFYSDHFLSRYGELDEYIEKRRAYGNSDDNHFSRDVRVPPEVILPGGIVASVNYKRDSIWSLEVDGDTFVVTNKEIKVPVTFPKRPSFYDLPVRGGVAAKTIATLYGDQTLGLFSPGHCQYFNTGSECRFCSLRDTRKTLADHAMHIVPELAREVAELAVLKEGRRLRHILLNGGTFLDYDAGFEKHLAILECLAQASLPPHIQRHLISMPPRNFNLFRRLHQAGSNIVMCLEVFDANLFGLICPGKATTYGRDLFMDAFQACVDVLGRGNVYCGFIAGLEPTGSLIDGITHMAELGVVPAVNVFHNDPGTQLASHPRPAVSELSTIGRHMSRIFRDNRFVPFIEGTGRNSLDTEAYLQCFSE